MFRISRLKKLRESRWMEQALELPPDKVEPPPAEETEDWGIQKAGLGTNVRFEVVADLLCETYGKILRDGMDGAASDGLLAVRLHKRLAGLSRREAADAGLWAHLAAFGCPRYVCWRWPGSKVLRMAGNVRRNALARLWWWAEVTHDHACDPADASRYALTLQTEGRQDLVLWFGDCAFSGNALVAQRLCALQKEEQLGSEEQQNLCRTVNRMSRAVCIDALPNKQDVRAACDRAYEISQSA